MKKIIVLLMVLVLVISAAGCRQNGLDAEVTQVTVTDGFTINNNHFDDTLPPPPPPDIPFDPYVALDYEMRDMTSWELIAEIQTGWNLGNTFESESRSINAEMAWGNPRTTFAMIQTVAEAGFDAVRIPVTWGLQVGEAPDYLINEAWMNRIEEVVGYVLVTGLYCILNTHHEDWIVPNEENYEHNSDKLIKIWEQIAERFMDYNEKLIFESMNEPRWIGSQREWLGGTFDEHLIINKLNQDFVNTVRASGGRNELRHLMVPSYAASAERAAMEMLSIGFPKDDERVIASIHAYIPYNFALQTNGNPNWSADLTRSTQDIDRLFERLQEFFVDKDIPVILGETGAVDRNGNLQARVDWTRYYFGKARDMGIPCFWWDNSLFYKGTQEEFFGLLDRHNLVFVFPEIIEAIMNN
jgi:endoglucanase